MSVRRALTAVASSCALAVTSSGCSFVATHGPPHERPPTGRVECTADSGYPNMDAMVFYPAFLVGLYSTRTESPSLWGTAFAVAAVYAAAGLTGSSRVERCKAAIACENGVDSACARLGWSRPPPPRVTSTLPRDGGLR